LPGREAVNGIEQRGLRLMELWLIHLAYTSS